MDKISREEERTVEIMTAANIKVIDGIIEFLEIKDEEKRQQCYKIAGRIFMEEFTKLVNSDLFKN